MDYLFINAAIKAKKNEFLTENQYQILNQISRKVFTKTLCDFNYGYTSNKQTLDGILKQEEEKLIKQLKFWLGEKHNLIKCYQLLHDLINIKILFKQLYFADNFEEKFDDFGLYNQAALEKAIKHSNYNLVSDDVELFQNLNLIPRNLSVFELTNEITKITYHYVYKKYIAKFDKYLKQYYQLKITTINILTVLRSLKLNLSIELLKSTLLEDSLIDNNILIDLLYNKKTPSNLKFYLPLYFDKAILNMNYEENNINELNQEFNRLILEIMNDFDYETNNLAPILSYVIKKKYEAKQIRSLYYSNKYASNNLFAAKENH